MAGIVSEIITAIRDLKKDVLSHQKGTLSTIDDASGGSLTASVFNNVESAAKRAKRSILNFPIIISDSIDPKVAHAIGQGYQFNCAEYVKVMIANDNIISATQGGVDAVKRNILARLRGGNLGETAQAGINNYLKNNMGRLCEALDASPDMFFGDPLYGNRSNLHETTVMKSSTADYSTSEFQHLFKTLAEKPMDFRTEMEVLLARAENDALFAKKSAGDLATMNTLLKSAGLPYDLSPGQKLSKHDAAVFDKITGIVTDDIHNRKKYSSNNSAAKRAATKAALRSRPAGSAAPQKMDLTRNVSISKSVSSSAKDNSYQPVLLDLTLSIMQNDTEIRTNLVVGVRTTIHRLSAEDMVSSVSKSFGTNSLVFQFLRCTSGELSFLKDFLFGIKDIKQQIAGSSKATNVLTKLKRQVSWNKRNANAIYREVSNNAMVPPTATLVLSSDEVQAIRSYTGFDLSKAGVAKKFLETFNLMGLMLVDSSIGAISMFEEGDGDFNMVSLDEMARRGKGDNTVRDVLSLMARN